MLSFSQLDFDSSHVDRSRSRLQGFAILSSVGSTSAGRFCHTAGWRDKGPRIAAGQCWARAGWGWTLSLTILGMEWLPALQGAERIMLEN